MTEVRITHIGGPTALLEIDGWRLLTDPTFDPPGRRYFFGWGTMSRKLEGPSTGPAELGEIDAVLLSHDHHDDNLDPAGRAMLPSAGTVITTAAGARRIGGGATGLQPWQTTTLERDGRPAIQITATPCRHGPPMSRAIVGDVIGFSLSWPGQEHGPLWITGDTVLYDGAREAAARLHPGVVIVHIGGVRFPVSGPLRYTMTAREAGELLGGSGAGTVIPIHYEGWKHFRQGRRAAEREFEAGPCAGRVRWLPIGQACTLVA